MHDNLLDRVVLIGSCAVGAMVLIAWGRSLLAGGGWGFTVLPGFPSTVCALAAGYCVTAQCAAHHRIAARAAGLGALACAVWACARHEPLALVSTATCLTIMTIAVIARHRALHGPDVTAGWLRFTGQDGQTPSNWPMWSVTCAGASTCTGSPRCGTSRCRPGRPTGSGRATRPAASA